MSTQPRQAAIIGGCKEGYCGKQDANLFRDPWPSLAFSATKQIPILSKEKKY